MSLCIVFNVCFYFTILSLTVSAMSRHQQELNDHYAHILKITNFECGPPQPRLLHVQELFSTSQIHGKAYFPEVTVLHRCDKYAGSCNDGTHLCAPKDVTNVSMPFKITFLENMDGHAIGQWIMEYHLLENHTSCGCIKAQEKPSKTIIHYHYIDPSLLPPPGITDQTQQNYAIPSIPEMTQIAEEVSKHNCQSNTGTEVQDYPAHPNSESPLHTD